jgi:hypothetical protein
MTTKIVCNFLLTYDIQGDKKVPGIEIHIQSFFLPVEYQTNYTPNESPENSRQEKLKIFKNGRIL